MLAYACRNSIAVAEATIRHDLGLSEIQMGIILGPAFFWPYALAQIPIGALGQRYGSRWIIPLLSIIWSAATACFGLGANALALIVSRAVTGLAQAGLFPCATLAISRWHPPTSRALANGTLAAFMSVGGALGAALTGVLLQYLDWLTIFFWIGAPGMIWAVCFFHWFRDFPTEHPTVNRGELMLIQKDASTPPEGKTETSSQRSRMSLADWLSLTLSPAMWMIAGQQFFRSAGYIFFASWFATYLQETRGVSTSESGILTVGPLIATVAASLLGGGLSDWLFRRTGSLNLARKGLAAICLSVCAVLVCAAYFIEHAHVAVAVISAGAFFAGFAGPCAYTATMDLGGNHVAAVFATMNMIGNFGAALLPWAVPYVRVAVENSPPLLRFFGDNSWNAVLILFAATYWLAAGCWMLLRMNGTVVEQSFTNRRRK
jgi:ACS family glucarate transporter-like MFS transporter/ACS family D-galactonate transporter-like MFS transporter